VQGPEVFDVLNAWAPDGTVIIVAYDQSVEGARKLIVLRRSPGAAAFSAPTTLAQGALVQVIGAAADRRGDIAIVVASTKRVRSC
jgi:hypothetical protein